MNIHPLRLALFDCDGTLTDGQAAVCRAMDTAFEHAGLALPQHHTVRRIVGLSLPQAVEKLAPGSTAQERQKVTEAYKSAFREARLAGQVNEPLYEGMASLLQRLHGAGWTLGVATGKSERGLKATLASNELAHLFSTLHTADTHPSKPDPAMIEAALANVGAEPRNTTMIGDTVYDMLMARNAGCRAIGVSWGYHEASELRDAGAIAVAETAHALEELLYADS